MPNYLTKTFVCINPDGELEVWLPGSLNNGHWVWGIYTSISKYPFTIAGLELSPELWGRQIISEL